VLTLHSVAVDPSRTTWSIELPPGPEAVLRPLEERDEDALADFLDGLSPATQDLYDVDEPKVHATEMCEAIDRLDKLRFVLEDSRGSIQGLCELSFGLPEGDRERFRIHGLELQPGGDVRFGACLADPIQGHGVGPRLWAKIEEVARGFGCSRVLLWGGVYVSNDRARRFYRRVGFTEVGRFTRHDARECIDMIVDLRAAKAVGSSRT
jgi:GNAT superfamily N-acetyltransferase